MKHLVLAGLAGLVLVGCGTPTPVVNDAAASRPAASVCDREAPTGSNLPATRCRKTSGGAAAQ